MKKLSLEQVILRSFKRGFEFLDRKYCGSKFKHHFKCIKHGGIYKCRFNNLDQGQKLQCCVEITRPENHKLKMQEVKTRSIKMGFEFLDKEYNFKCIKDKEIHKSTFDNINNGNGLKCCRIRKASERRGKKHPNWKSSPKERIRIEEHRTNSKYKKCNMEIDKRDNKFCRKCGCKGSKIHRHHIKSWKYFPKLRYDINNIITFCKKCHIDFHSKNGTGKNNWKNFNKFISNSDGVE